MEDISNKKAQDGSNCNNMKSVLVPAKQQTEFGKTNPYKEPRESLNRQRTFSTGFDFPAQLGIDRKNSLKSSEVGSHASPRKVARQTLAQVAKKTLQQDKSYTDLREAITNL